MRVRKFIRGENFYFQLLDNEGLVLLNSQSYSSKSDRNNGVDSVEKNLQNRDRYANITEDGKSYFILKAGNNQEIARSRAFDNADELEKVKRSLYERSQGGSSQKSDVSKQADGGEAYGTDGKSDDYKPLGFYKDNRSGSANGFDIFNAEGESYFAYCLDNQVYLISEGYKSDSSRDNGVNSVTKNMTNADRYQRQQHPNGKHFFNLRAGNNQEIATSIWFDSEGEMNRIIGILTSGGKGAGSSVGTASTDTGNQALGISSASASEAAPKKKRKKRAKKPKTEKVEVGAGTYPCSGITYKIFKSGNGKLYFTYRDEKDKAILISSNIRGYTTIEEVQNVIDQIAVNGSKADNFEERPTSNGKHYYYLKDDNGKNLGKSFFFNTVEEMRTAMKLFDCGMGGAVAASGGGNAQAIDEYLDCDAYKGHDKSSIDSGFTIFSHEGESYFAMVNESGEVLLRSEGYTSEKSRDNGIQSVLKNRELDERWSIAEEEGKYFSILKAGNHQEIGRSCPYADDAAARYWWPGAIAGRKAEHEAKLKAEEAARLKAEQEAKLKAEEEARIKAEREAKLKAEEEGGAGGEVKGRGRSKIKSGAGNEVESRERGKIKSGARGKVEGRRRVAIRS